MIADALSFLSSFFFFFTVTATSEIYTLSLHDALPISLSVSSVRPHDLALSHASSMRQGAGARDAWKRDRKSTRLNSSHVSISYAVFCLKKKKKIKKKKIYTTRQLTYRSIYLRCPNRVS